MFKSERLQALVREMIQNSLDARSSASEPVVVRFTLDTTADLEETGFSELALYFSAAHKLERTAAGKSFYRRAIDQVADGNITLLGVHDYNTMGLTGPTYDPPEDPQSGPWLALVKGAGMTYKESNSALGSFGHGSRAPFAMSELRTLFYLTRIDNDGSRETRFQGKSILQSVPLTEVTGEQQWCVATGYFGLREKCLPLVDSQIPSWAIDGRPENDANALSVGTSIYIPEPYGVEEEELLWAEVKLAVIANFYYAVLTNKLVVHLGQHEQIDADSIAQAFDDVVDTDLINTLRPTDKVVERLESARTVRHHDLAGALELDDFGTISWYLRLDGVVGRRVGVARGNGMLITRAAEKLQRFPGLKPFDLFVCVAGDQGSELLRKLENPEHTEFAFDRISDMSERKSAETAYYKFQSRVRDLLREYASVEIDEEVSVDDLDDWFRADFGAGTDSDSGEPNRALRIAFKKTRSHRENKQTERTGETTTSGRGSSGGDGKHKTKGGQIPGEGSGSAKGALRTGLPVRNLRVVRTEPGSGVADVSFTPVDGSRRTLVLLRSGDSETERLEFRTEAEAASEAPWRTSLEFAELSATARKRLRLVFHSDDLDYAIEGRLEP
ncbi:hypothetical protein BEP68_01745 [Microbacterium sp. 4-7]|nr:hypothetical protein [Microbacterium sp. 4-7]